MTPAIMELRQHAKKVVSDSLGLVDFTIELVNNFEEFKLHKNCVINPAHQNVFGAS